MENKSRDLNYSHTRALKVQSPNISLATLQLLEPIFGISVKESEIEIFKNYARRRPSTEENSDLGLAEVAYSHCVIRTFSHLSTKCYSCCFVFAYTVPQTSVTVERLFSSVKRIKQD